MKSARSVAFLLGLAALSSTALAVPAHAQTAGDRSSKVVPEAAYNCLGGDGPGSFKNSHCIRVDGSSLHVDQVNGELYSQDSVSIFRLPVPVSHAICGLRVHMWGHLYEGEEINETKTRDYGDCNAGEEEVSFTDYGGLPLGDWLFQPNSWLCIANSWPDDQHNYHGDKPWMCAQNQQDGQDAKPHPRKIIHGIGKIPDYVK